MNVLNALINLRNDLKTWVSNNLKQKSNVDHTHNSVIDSGNGKNTIGLNYSAEGLNTTSWFAAWNGSGTNYELRGISPANTLSTIGAAAASHTHTAESIGAMKTGNYTSEDLNKIITSGVYRLSDINANKPNGTSYGQLLVMHSAGDTITQICTGYTSDNVYIRYGNPSEVGGTGEWREWRKILTGSFSLSGTTLTITT